MLNIFYFIHATGRDHGNSGIPRVTKSLACELHRTSGVELFPVCWDAKQKTVVHADRDRIETLARHNGPRLPFSPTSCPIHLSAQTAARESWIFIPEAPHLGVDVSGSVLLPSILGYARRHDFKTAAILYDIMPLSHFGEDNPEKAYDLKWMIYANSLPDVDLVLPISRASAMHLSNWLEQQGVTWRGGVIEPVLLPHELSGVRKVRAKRSSNRKRSGAPIEFAMWGSALPHKNQVRVLRAFNKLLASRPDLNLRLNVMGSVAPTVVGSVRREVSRAKGRIFLHGFVTDQELRTIIARCRASVFVSLAEGFGLPVAESMWLGKPCLTSHIAPMTEVAEGGGCLLVDPSDEHAIANALEQLAVDDELVDRLTAELQKRPWRLWSDYASAVLNAMRHRFRDADRGDKLLQFNRSLQAPLQVESLIIDACDMWVPEERREAWMLTNRAAICFTSDPQQEWREASIFFGPYRGLKAGRYQLRLQGRLEGELLVRVTSGNGRNNHAERILANFGDLVEVALECDVTGFEVVGLTRETTKEVELTAVIVDRVATAPA